MISWHRVGQKVTLVDGPVFTEPCVGSLTGKLYPDPQKNPEVGEIYTIIAVKLGFHSEVGFKLNGFDQRIYWRAKWFRPVYPTIIDQLRKLDAPSLEAERVREDV